MVITLQALAEAHIPTILEACAVWPTVLAAKEQRRAAPQDRRYIGPAAGHDLQLRLGR